MAYFKKKLLLVLLLSSFIVFFVSGSSNATTTHYQENDTYNIDTTYLLKEYQERLATYFLVRFDRLATDQQKETLKSYGEGASADYYWPLFNYQILSTGAVQINLYMIPTAVNYDNLESSGVNTNDELFYDYYFTYAITGFNADSSSIGNIRRFSVNFNNSSVTVEYTSRVIFIPSLLIMNRPSALVSYYNGVDPRENAFAMIWQAISENTEQEEETTDELKKLNDFMSSDDVDDDAYDMPGYSDNPTQDITQDGINDIFNMFYETITNWDSSLIVVPIPFTGKSFTIRPNLTEQIVDGFANGALKVLLGIVWYYLLGVYVVKDIQKYIDGLQTGEILTKTDTNIKTEML